MVCSDCMEFRLVLVVHRAQRCRAALWRLVEAWLLKSRIGSERWISAISDWDCFLHIWVVQSHRLDWDSITTVLATKIVSSCLFFRPIYGKCCLKWEILYKTNQLRIFLCCIFIYYYLTLTGKSCFRPFGMISIQNWTWSSITLS